MPLVDVSFRRPDGHADPQALHFLGPSIQVVVTSFSPAVAGSTGSPSEVCPALIDTGAMESCIDQQLAQRLALPQIDVIAIAGAGGRLMHPVYLAQVFVPVLNFVQYGRFAGVDLAAGGQQHGVLLGRSFLSLMLLIYDGGRAQVTLACPGPPPPPGVAPPAPAAAALPPPQPAPPEQQT